MYMLNNGGGGGVRNKEMGSRQPISKYAGDGADCQVYVGYLSKEYKSRPV